VTDEDVAGPFVAAPLPDDMMELAKLDALGYTSPLEMLAERFHAQPALLTHLNQGTPIAAGQTITVPNVEPFYPPAPGNAPTPTLAAGAARVRVSEATRTVRVEQADGSMVFQAPVTFGSEQDPLPKGELGITGTAVLPVFHYNPELFWDADPSHAKAKLAPGPNNPVGVVWIDLDKEHLGFHGTPEPSTIGRAQSHGCLRLTNWDAMRLAGLVGRGARVILQ
jgi:lipoprotein-anchoring transpeptidase ErfK/SrfK